MDSIRQRVKELIKRLDPHDKHVLENAVKKRGLSLKLPGNEDEARGLLPADGSDLAVLYKGKTPKKLLDSFGIYKKATILDAKEPRYSQAARISEELKSKGIRRILAFGGGVANDVSKQVACMLWNTNGFSKNFYLFSTIGSNDGLLSSNASLFYNEKRQTLPSCGPANIIIPLYIWDANREKTLRYTQSGIMDVLTNITALQDFSLAVADGYEELTDENKEFMVYALRALDQILRDSKDTVSRARALFYSGLSMCGPLDSKPASNSEHSIQRPLQHILENFKNIHFPHGQTAGAGMLIAAKKYEIDADKLPKNLYFNSSTIFTDTIKILQEAGLHEFAMEPIKTLGHEGMKEILFEICLPVKDTPVRADRYGILDKTRYSRKEWGELLSLL